MPVNEIDVAIPTHESGAVIGETLDRLATAEANGDVDVGRIVVVDDESDDDTRGIVRDRAETCGWDCDVLQRETTLPEARKLAIDRVTRDWFLFLDDDVRIAPDYLDRLADAAAPAIGAIQGRKHSRTERPSEWTRRRSRRGGTHATLVRREAVRGIEFPADLLVLEDEYLRRYVEDRGFLWIFHHGARFRHENQHRHPVGWREGWLGGKYDLLPFQRAVLNAPYAALTGRDPRPHAKRALGWIAGRAARNAGDRLPSVVHVNVDRLRRYADDERPTEPERPDAGSEAERAGGRSATVGVDLGCGPDKRDGTIGLDIRPFDGVDVLCDLNVGLPFRDSTVGRFYAYRILEHVDDLPFVMSEIHRVAENGSIVEGLVPHYTDRNAYIDPTHQQYFDVRTFDFWDSTTELGQRGYFDPEFRVRKARRIRRVQFWKSRPIEFELEVIK